ncbi:exopolyphosphatase [Terrihabitans rhizophilus]|uniref:exopolyphosphatase n=1 Tax=Terrihabitans rhizophilus TaxID=3092662 RepID=A0ABU4RM23_9HYPH|nr:exopolyphosphatase [Terrihabitans sp. PJ23]MDX6805278.1 exopolyphosphatase [Terrihabitans sp. PJ23]
MGATVAVIDIGSNSVRLVAYEGLARSPTPLFNEKAMCGLGRSVALTGRLADEAVACALAALRRFRALCDVMNVGQLWVLATAAARDAENGQAFLEEASRICRAEIQLLSGKREAYLSALGIVSGVHDPDGIVGDMGGGSLELVRVFDRTIGNGITLPLGGLFLQDAADGQIKKAEKLIVDQLKRVPDIASYEGKTFYAVGGTWRALARLHMSEKDYPLRVMHGYTIPAKEALAFCRRVATSNPAGLRGVESVASDRRPLLPYGALLLQHIITAAKPQDVMISGVGVREGLLYEVLDDAEKQQDPLVTAAADLSALRSRSPRHGYELVDWTDQLFESAGLDESDEEARLRHAACHLGDLGWRAHPDYRGEQSFNIIANAAFVGVDHSGRGYLALAVYYRHEGLRDEGVSPRLRALVTPRLLEQARLLGAAMRVAYLVSASTPGVLPRAALVVSGDRLVLTLPPELADLKGDRLANRVRQMAKLLGKEPAVQVSP